MSPGRGEVTMTLTQRALLFLLLALPHASCGPTPPHLFLIVLDDVGWNDLGFQRGALAGQDNGVLTPHIDALAGEGVALHDFTTFKFCSPARTQLLTGRFAYHLGQQTPLNLNPDGKACGVPLAYTMLPSVLSRAGYASHALGKWHQVRHRP